jgi:hypothetical protein
LCSEEVAADLARAIRDIIRHERRADERRPRIPAASAQPRLRRAFFPGDLAFFPSDKVPQCG